MFRKGLLILVLLVSVFMLAGCPQDAPRECDDDDDCPSNHMCISDVCIPKGERAPPAGEPEELVPPAEGPEGDMIVASETPEEVPGEPVIEPECETNMDCYQGFVCIGGFCEVDESIVIELPPTIEECKKDAECGKDKYCGEGKCYDMLEVAPTCNVDKDCPIRHYCWAGYCFFEVEGAECKTHDDCPGLDYCYYGKCVAAEEDMGCMSDADCGPNEYCEMDGFCYPMPTLGKGCFEDADCDSGEICVDGLCNWE